MRLRRGNGEAALDRIAPNADVEALANAAPA